MRADEIEKTRILKLVTPKESLSEPDSSKIFNILALVREESMEPTLKSLDKQTTQVDSNGNTPLFWAAVFKSVKVVAKLIKAGADTKHKGKSLDLSADEIIVSEWSETDKNELNRLLGK